MLLMLGPTLVTMDNLMVYRLTSHHVPHTLLPVRPKQSAGKVLELKMWRDDYTDTAALPEAEEARLPKHRSNVVQQLFHCRNREGPLVI